MSVRHALLALLSEGPKYGLQLALPEQLAHRDPEDQARQPGHTQ